MDISYFTTLQAGWLNAWIPSFGMMLVEYLYVQIYKDGGKRALDSSWRNKKDKINYMTCSLLQLSLLVLSIFVPLKMEMAWLLTGSVIYILSLAGFIWSIHSYAAAPGDQVISNGIYRWSRNPMYVCFFTSVFGTCIASASLWLLIILIPLIVVTHLSILGEERFCVNTYGEAYMAYKAKTPRYALFR